MKPTCLRWVRSRLYDWASCQDIPITMIANSLLSPGSMNKETLIQFKNKFYGVGNWDIQADQISIFQFFKLFTVSKARSGATTHMDKQTNIRDVTQDC